MENINIKILFYRFVICNMNVTVAIQLKFIFKYEFLYLLFHQAELSLTH